MTPDTKASDVALLPCPFCGAAGDADNGFAPLESVVYAFCSNSHCHLHDVGIGFSPQEWNKRANQQPSAQWIAVSESLPDCEEWVLVYDGARVYESMRAGYHDDFYWSGEHANRPVTHWRPLPAPPQAPDERKGS